MKHIVTTEITDLGKHYEQRNWVDKQFATEAYSKLRPNPDDINLLCDWIFDNPETATLFRLRWL